MAVDSIHQKPEIDGARPRRNIGPSAAKQQFRVRSSRQISPVRQKHRTKGGHGYDVAAGVLENRGKLSVIPLVEIAAQPTAKSERNHV